MQLLDLFLPFLLASTIPFTLAYGYGDKHHLTCKAKTLYKTITKTTIRDKTITNNIIITKTVKVKSPGATVTATVTVTRAPDESAITGKAAATTCPPSKIVYTSKICPDRDPCPESRRCVRDAPEPIFYGCDCIGKPPTTITVDHGCPNECCDFGYYRPYRLDPDAECSIKMAA
ncbi:hypothetical protein TWF506_002128 [Arthrobotrys conoides]|uniref:Uncharacterized protein n=1 Tax=Arthrobotrys conoides TaxID=74498 RepID=A0AAN8S2D9_9PEZI